MEFTEFRDQLPVTSENIYMNTGWSGPSPSSVISAIHKHLLLESAKGPTSPLVLDISHSIENETRDSFAKLLNVQAKEITLTQNTTDGLNIVINGIDWQAGDELITFSLEHSSVLIPAYYLQQRKGVVVKVIDLKPDEEHDSIIFKVQNALTERTKLLFFSHIQYTSGLRMPAKELGKLTKANGTKMLLDGAQTAGHISLDLKDLDCDYYAITGHKWLLGPEGVGALYIKEDLIEALTPAKVSGRAALKYDQFGGYDPATLSAKKFELTSTNAALFAGANEAIKFHFNIGAQNIEMESNSLANYAKNALKDLQGITLHSPLTGNGCTGLVAFSIENWEPKDLVNIFWEKRNIVSRSVKELKAVRLSLDFFNTTEEIDQVIKCIKELI
jgi:L-cysteine/cystine lyase